MPDKFLMMQIESVIGHEYFHNWTGNRVTCRDWFQVSTKVAHTPHSPMHTIDLRANMICITWLTANTQGGSYCLPGSGIFG